MRYPWHALHGQALDVERELTADDERVYVIALSDGSLTHLPVWMTETAAAAPATVVTSPAVSIAGLVALRRLLDAVLDVSAAAPDAQGRR
ncbi:hypothetical protein [Gemmatimonas sp.]|uniref:hypothetical protein n=1 Tax=Gemmatimonas sp. TaxID=1962908 RepID=UPI00286D2F48|nr:hypothetical protein [Gemmatimonas sp.]